MKKNNLMCVICIIVLIGVFGCSKLVQKTPLPTQPPKTIYEENELVTIRELVNYPDKFFNTTIKVNGKLINIGKSYFQPNFVISDGTNNFPVSAWLPLEVPPPFPGSSQEHTSTMGDYLDKIITLEGVVEKDAKSFYIGVIRVE